jgi:alpha-beta hydrolase superfamily lysophospholipase
MTTKKTKNNHSNKYSRIVFGVARNIDVPETVFLTDEEVELTEAPLPTHEHGWFTSCHDHVQLHYRKFIPKNDVPIAVAIFMHGIATHSGQALIIPNNNNNNNQGERKLWLALVAEKLLQNQMALYAFDLYGHGYSEGTRFWIHEYQEHVTDYIAFCRLVSTFHPDIPFFLIGDSYGGTLTLNVVKHLQDAARSGNNPLKTLDSMILLTPAILADLPSKPVLKFLIFLARMFPKWKPCFMPNPIAPEKSFRDPAVLKEITDPRYVQCGMDGSTARFRLGTGWNLIQAMENAKKLIPQIRTPFCILHGTTDQTVLIAGSELLYDHSNTRYKKFMRYEGAYHDLLADPCAEECIHDILDWIHERLERYDTFG